MIILNIILFLILIQSRTYPCSKKEFEEFKKRKIPSCFNDLFEGNIG
jgi:hypothetical protein